MFIIIGADGKEYGPVSVAQIQEWMAGGRANLQTKARRSNGTEWLTLGEFVEFGGMTVPTPPVAHSVPPLPETLPTPEAPEAALVTASRWLRLGAYVLDTIIGLFFIGPGFVILVLAGVFTNPNNPNPAYLLAGIVAAGTGALVLMGIQIYLLVTRGQTLGKKMLGIRIVSFDDESNPGFVRVFLIRILVNGLLGAVPVIGLAYTLADLCFIFREDRRCIHDLLANTKVVVAR